MVSTYGFRGCGYHQAWRGGALPFTRSSSSVLIAREFEDIEPQLKTRSGGHFHRSFCRCPTGLFLASQVREERMY